MTVVCLCTSALATAQNALVPGTVDPAAGNAASNAAGITGAPPYVPLSLGEKYLYTLGQTMAAPAMVGFAIHAIYDQYRDDPHQWGMQSESLGVRMASRFGRTFVRENIAFGIRAIDHEDPRYFRAGHGTGWNRTRYALKSTFLAHTDNGGIMPAYARLAGDCAAPFIAQSWRPEPFRMSLGFRGGAAAVSMNAVSNVWQEFWPDLKKKIPLRRFRQP